MPRTWTEEQKKAFGEKMKLARESKQVPQMETKPVEYLDLTSHELRDKGHLRDLIMFKFVETRDFKIKVTPKQALLICDWGEIEPLASIRSPFGFFQVEIVR